VAVVGAGGKTSLIAALAREGRAAGLSVLVTTTTAMYDPRQRGDLSFDSFLEEAPQGPLPPASVSFLATRFLPPRKVGGPPPEALAGLAAWADLLLVEADGSRGLPLKAPAAHEPVLPPAVDVVIACVGLEALGRPARADLVHRLSDFLALTGRREGEPIDEDSLVELACREGGLFKGCGVTVRRLLCLGQADLLEGSRAEALARSLGRRAGLEGVILRGRGRLPLYFPGLGGGGCHA
jgi:probable selenium-dependent hydroxylase accessory protein YqeC